MNRNPASRSYLVLLIAMAFLFMLQWAYPHIGFMNTHFKNSRLLSYFLVDNEAELPTTTTGLDSALLAQIDSLNEETTDSSSQSISNPAPLNEIDEAWFKNDTLPIPESANLEALSQFFSSQKGINKKKKTRISYWGDSMIEGDLITQTLRKKMQQRYGGEGVGFVPFVSITAGFRRTLVHRFSGPWSYHSLVKNLNEKTGPYGYSGEYHRQKRDSVSGKVWASYAAAKGASSWNLVKVFYGKGDGRAVATVRINQGNWRKYPLTDTQAVNQLIFNDTGIRSLDINFDSAWNSVLYGVSLESVSGIQVDNLSLRGNSGMLQTRIPGAVFYGFDEKHHPDLIILHYGVNAINAATTQYDWYEKALIKMVRHYQHCFPNSSILLVGVADKGFLGKDKMVTDPSVYRVLKTQYRVALKTGVAFWNLYAAMGGEGTMVRWVESDRPLANKDYTHFNFYGSEKVGTMLFEFLMNEENKYGQNN